MQADHHIQARWPDFITVDKERNTFQVVDFAIPGSFGLQQFEVFSAVSHSLGAFMPPLLTFSEDSETFYELSWSFSSFERKKLIGNNF